MKAKFYQTKLLKYLQQYGLPYQKLYGTEKKVDCFKVSWKLLLLYNLQKFVVFCWIESIDKRNLRSEKFGHCGNCHTSHVSNKRTHPRNCYKLFQSYAINASSLIYLPDENLVPESKRKLKVKNRFHPRIVHGCKCSRTEVSYYRLWRCIRTK